VQLVIPAKTIRELGRLLQEDELNNVTIAPLKDNQLAFQFGAIVMMTRLIDGQFPDYDKVIPAPSKSVMSCNRLELANAIMQATSEFGVRSKGVDYDAFPVDTGTIVANDFLNAGGKLPLVIASNNIYHDWDTTMKLGAAAVGTAGKLGRKVALVGVGGLSGTIFREEIDISTDHIASDSDNEWNQRVLSLMEAGDLSALTAACPEFAKEARVDMGFKHFAWLLGGMNGKFQSAKVHAYGPVWGSGAAVVEFNL